MTFFLESREPDRCCSSFMRVVSRHETYSCSHLPWHIRQRLQTHKRIFTRAQNWPLIGFDPDQLCQLDPWPRCVRKGVRGSGHRVFRGSYKLNCLRGIGLSFVWNGGCIFGIQIAPPSGESWNYWLTIIKMKLTMNIKINWYSLIYETIDVICLLNVNILKRKYDGNQ